jgi:hypothetical protein
VTMQVFVRDDCPMIAAPVQGHIDGIPKGSHFRKTIFDGVDEQLPFHIARESPTAPPTSH